MTAPLYTPGQLARLDSANFNPPQQGSESNSWTVAPGISLHHFSHGKGAKVLVVHGGPGIPIEQPPKGLESLGDRFEFVYYHQRGCGKSTRPRRSYGDGNYLENTARLDEDLGLATQIADIERIRRLLGEQQLILLGHSYGAFLATLYAAEFPDRVRALVLAAPADLLTLPAEGGGLFERIRERLPGSARRDYAEFIDRYLDFGSLFSRTEADLVALQLEFVDYYARATGRQFARAKIESSAGGFMVWAQFLGMGQRHDYRPALDKVRAPTLVLHGEKDLLPDRASRRYSDSISGARFTVLAADHFLLESPAIALPIGKFLANMGR